MADEREVVFLLNGQSNILHSYAVGAAYAGETINLFDNPCEENRDLRFTSWLTNGVKDPKRLNEIGLELVDLINGAISCFHESAPRITLAKFFIDNVRYSNDSRLTASDDFLDLVAQNPVQEIALNAEPCQLIIDAKADVVKYALLKYISYEQNWVTLYRIYETLKNIDVDLVKIQGFKAKEFTNAANNFNLTGLYSRHGVVPSKGQSQNQTKAMDSPTAREYIKQCVRKYVNIA